MSAEISASATTPVRNSCWSPGRRNGSAGRSNGFAIDSDAFLGDFHGRDLTSEAELALDRGRQLPRAARDQHQQSRRQRDLVRAAGEGDRGLLQRLPHPGVVSCAASRVVTNTTPTSAYRSAGRPEVVFVLERLIDIACRRHGFDRLDLRRRNLVPPEAMPYRNPLGLVYDSGDYPASLRRAAELGDWAGFAARRAEATAARPVSRHRRRGFGRAEYRRAARAGRDDHRSGGHGRARAGHDVGGPGARDELRAGRRRMARRRSRARQACHRRHRSGAGRRRLGLGALDAARLLGDGQGRRRDRRERPADRRRRARGRRGRYRIRPAGVSS